MRASYTGIKRYCNRITPEDNNITVDILFLLRHTIEELQSVLNSIKVLFSLTKTNSEPWILHISNATITSLQRFASETREGLFPWRDKASAVLNELKDADYKVLRYDLER